ncbi:putative redox protein [Gillisia sp. Hel_I_86]|uniref:bifunctional alpha/beta hydrolase/OsmC family protein n=1 Tax=Gillisia sp. Hel_I_86 TaxID=1249981 RepID=UPI00119BBD03|nr:bifunctional alpha/beta hydrolase/OsmC family protein [Gillisia sp. Hel_I_86]TVZ27617.1 putative redox protein [Gillisia sp. Hel_I_86]
MSTLKITFKNKEGFDLKGSIELPENRNPHNFVLFAHCFTCNKNFLAVRNISKALITKGFGVLRFDFTGLGESEGEFADSNFSGNVEDLIEAAGYLEENYKAPSLLIGHSLGGAAVLLAATLLPSVTAVATIGAPSHIGHVKNLLKNDVEDIQKNGIAEVNIGGRKFNIKKQFLDDLENNDLPDIISKLNKSLLILHSPQDRIVGIKNAEEIYIAAKHPKSFISLDGGDHLLSNKMDSSYAGDIIGSWAYRYIDIPEQKNLKTNLDVVAHLGPEGFTTQIKAGRHNLIADEPEHVGGNDFGPNPYEYVSAGLAACTSMTIQMYAKRKGWIVDSVDTQVNYGREHALDCEKCEEAGTKIDTFKRELIIKGDLDEKQRNRLLEIANKCPVHKTLHSETQIITSLVDPK